MCAVPLGRRRGSAKVHIGTAHLVQVHQHHAVRTRIIRRAIASDDHVIVVAARVRVRPVTSAARGRCYGWVTMLMTRPGTITIRLTVAPSVWRAYPGWLAVA